MLTSNCLKPVTIFQQDLSCNPLLTRGRAAESAKTGLEIKWRKGSAECTEGQQRDVSEVQGEQAEGWAPRWESTTFAEGLDSLTALPLPFLSAYHELGLSSGILMATVWELVYAHFTDEKTELRGIK